MTSYPYAEPSSRPGWQDARVDEQPLRGMTIGITAERRAEEQADLFHRRGAETIHGPTLRIVSMTDDELLRAVTLDVIRQPPDFLLASTGFGMRTWFAAAEGWGVKGALLEALGHAKVANRGAKAASANTAAGLIEWWRAPSERFEELVERVLAEPLAGCRLVLQLHGCVLPGAVARLEAAGASVLEVDAYRARLPVDTAPARALIEAACDNRLAAVTFTTAPAVHNLFALAAQAGRDDELRQALNGPVVAACVGPVCAEGALEEGLTAPLVPERARLVPLVQAVADRLGR
jgi:uroporphyrinogen-III synthase